jgi:hypothetical protein
MRKKINSEQNLISINDRGFTVWVDARFDDLEKFFSLLFIDLRGRGNQKSLLNPQMTFTNRFQYSKCMLQQLCCFG